MSHRLLVANQVLEFLDGLKPRERLHLRERFIKMADFPSHYSDFQEYDSVGRALDVHLFGRFAITYWADFADRDLKILRVELADR